MTGEPTAPIAIETLAHSFGDQQVLGDVSLTVEPGELVGLVGPNGAGKTTLLRTTSGALEPDAGRVEIDGVDVTTAPSKVASRLVAVVPQDTALSFSFPVRDVVAMGRYPHRSRFAPATDEDRRAVEYALERTRTSDLADRRIDEISGGQRQRVIVARALAQETPALLLDEPTASLDVNHQLETLELVREVVDDGTAAMAAIHDLSLAARYCDRLALLAGGTLQQIGPPAEVLTTDAVGDAFDASAVVATDPVSGATSVTALPSGPSGAHARSQQASDDAPADATGTVSETTDESAGPPAGGDVDVDVHVLGAGPTASSTIARLALADVRPTIGPLPTGDVVGETAAQFDLEVHETDPFSAPSPSTTSDVLDAIERADVVVVASPILGDDDAFDRLLEAVLEADAVIGISDERDPSRSSDQIDTARGVVDSGRVSSPVLESLAARLERGRIVDCESVVEAVERERTAIARADDERAGVISDSSSAPAASTPDAKRTVESESDPVSDDTEASQAGTPTADAETDGGVTSGDRSVDVSE